MGLSRPLSILVPFGVFSCLQLAFSADSSAPSADLTTCAPEMCGETGAGTCFVAGLGYVCMCKEGFRARSNPPGCASIDEVEGSGPYEEGTSDGSTETLQNGEDGDSSIVRETLPDTVQLPSGDGEGSEERSTGAGDTGVGKAGVPPVSEEPQHEGGSEMGDPCSTNPCGNPDAVDCIPIDDADGSFGCRCKVGYVLESINGKQECLGFTAGPCVGAPCNPGHGCVGLSNGYRCVCASGYHSVVQGPDGNPSCVADSEGDACSHNGCGTQEAVRGCYPGTNGERQCVCNDGYYVVQAPDGASMCIQPGEEAEASGVPPYPSEGPFGTEEGPGPTAGSESAGMHPEGGEHQGPEAGVVGPHGFGGGGGAVGGVEAETQQGGAASGYEGAGGYEKGAWGQGGETSSETGGESTHGGATGGDGEGKGGKGADEDHTEEQTGGNGAMIAGGVIGALILVAAAGGGAAMYNKSQSRGESLGGEEVDFEPTAQATVEVEPDESEILINVSQNDWAS